MVKNNNIDVLFLSHRYEITSGGEKALLDLIEYTVSIGLRVHVIIGGNGSIVPRLNKLNIPYTIVHMPFWAHGGEDPSPFIFNQPLNPRNNTVLQIYNLISDLQPRLCVTNTIVVPWLAYAAAIANIPHAWMIHELDASGLDLNYAIEKAQILKTIDNLSDKIFYNSKYTAQYYLPKFTNNKEVAVVYPGGKLDTFKEVPSPYTTTGLKIINVGQIKPQKGQIDCVKAGIELHKAGVEFELLLVGGINEDDFAYRDNLIDLIDSAGAGEKIRLIGHSNEPAALMQHADIAINSATSETFGRVTVEAMLSGLAVIGANSAGTAEIIQHDKTGLLYKPGDHIELSNTILRLNDEPLLLKKISNTALKEAEDKYSDNERFKSFISYLSSNPIKTSLDLSPLAAILSDFNKTVALSVERLPLTMRINKRLRKLAKNILRKK